MVTITRGIEFMITIQGWQAPMNHLEKILLSIDKLNEWVAKIVSWVVILIILATVYEIIMRYVFNAPTKWVFEFNYLVHGPYFLLLGAYTFAQDAHVNVDILQNKLSPRSKAMLNLLTMTFFFIFVGVMLVFGWRFAMNSLSFRETLSSAWAPPVYPVKLVIPVAAFLLMLQGIVKYIRSIQQVISGKEVNHGH